VVLPFYGFLIDADEDHRRRVDGFFQVPMLILALLVLPILIAEYYFRNSLTHPWVPPLLEAAFFIIALAFLIEFVIKVTIAQSRWRYCLANWVDILIIVLPFLRPFRVARALRVAQLSRVYTLRGVSLKLVRTGAAFVLGLEFAHKMKMRFVKPQPQSDAPPDYTQWSKAALISEIERLQKQVSELERRDRHYSELES
jgi:hypothetical protein